jgi:DNA-binding NarL/FixJ family response regulator
MSIKILLADDHEIVREGLRVLFEKQTDMKVVAEANDGHEAVQLAQQLTPDVVIMDVSMPRMNGMEATRRIVGKYPGIKIIALSRHREKRIIRDMLDAGASSYIHKACGYLELLKAVRAALENRRHFCPPNTAADRAGGTHASRQRRRAAGSTLTAREREVLQLLTEGKTTREVAALLDVSVKTVETHRHQIMTKLSTHSIADLTKFAIREGITSLED